MMLPPLLSKIKIPGIHTSLLWLSMVLVAIVAWPFKFYFLNDDLIHIPLAASGKIGHHNSVRFIGDLSLMLDHFLYGKSASGYHLTNLLLHLLNVFLFWKMLNIFTKGFGKENYEWPVLYASLLFAFFGFHSDAIFWIIGRSASLGCFFFLLTILCFLNFDKSVIYKGGAMLFWVAALLSYESVWILPFILLGAYKINWKSQPASAKLHSTWIFIMWFVFGLYLIMRKIVTAEWLGTYEASSFQSFHIGQLLGNYLKLIARTIIPPMENNNTFLVLAAIGGFLILLLNAGVLILKRMNKYWVFIIVCWLFSYLPYLSLGISARTIESERFLYLPSLFFAASIIYTLFLLFKNKMFIFHVAAITIIVFNFLNFARASCLYQQNGQLVNKTFSLLSEPQPTKLLEIRNLPLTIYGIPVFRSGFEEGYHWLANPIYKTQIVTIDSILNTQSFLTPSLELQGNKSILIFNATKP